MDPIVRNVLNGNPMVVQGSVQKHRASAGGKILVPDQRTKILHTMWHGQKKKKRKKERKKERDGLS